VRLMRAYEGKPDVCCSGNIGISVGYGRFVRRSALFVFLGFDFLNSEPYYLSARCHGGVGAVLAGYNPLELLHF